MIKGKKIIITIGIIMLLIIAIPVTVYGHNLYLYKNDLKQADSLLINERYDDAIKAFSNLLSIKYVKPDKKMIDSKVNLASTLKVSKEAYEAAIKTLNDKNYLEAIESFKNVKEIDSKRYNESQEKIKEAGNLYISDNMAKAKSEAESKKYDSAISFLDIILKFDQNNQEAANLKNTYAKELQNINAQEEAKKKAEDEAKKKVVEESSKNTESTSNQSGKQNTKTGSNQQTSNTNKPITTEVDGESLVIHDNGKEIIIQFHEIYGVQTSFIYDLISIIRPEGTTEYGSITLNYTATFKIGNAVTNVSSQTTNRPAGQALYLNISNDAFQTGNIAFGTAEIKVTYKGKVYSFNQNIRTSRNENGSGR